MHNLTVSDSVASHENPRSKERAHVVDAVIQSLPNAIEKGFNRLEDAPYRMIFLKEPNSFR